MKRFPLALLVLLTALGLGCPIGPFSGGRLGGEEHEPPPDWSIVNDVENCQLETNPGDPHSINCWCFGAGEKVWVPTSMILGPTNPSEREWVKNVQADPDVRLRVDGKVYLLRAVKVDDPSEFAEALAGLEEKYDADPAERESERVIWLYRLEER